MIGFADGPAAGSVLALHRAPTYLRVVISPSGKVDALDQLEDTPKPREAIHVYRLEAPATDVHINMGSTKRGSGFYKLGTYRHLPDVDGEAMRETDAWQEWARAQPPLVREPLAAGSSTP